MPKRLTTEQFIDISNKKHNFKYRYTNVMYINNTSKVKIYCPLHDIFFEQSPKHHMRGFVKCNKCTDEKRKMCCLEKHGVENISQSPKIKEKIKKQCLEKHGVEHHLQLKKFMDKQKKTNLEKYGVEYYLQLDVFKEQYKKTCLDKFGYDNPFKSPKIKEKIKEKCLEKYGVSHHLQLKKIIDKQKQTNLERYGVEYPTQNKEIKEKIRNTCFELYGVDHHNQKHISKDSLKKLKNKDWLILQHHTNELPIGAIANKLNVNHTTVSKYLHNFGIEVCYYNKSVDEKELGGWLISLDYKIETNQWNIIPPFEIDIFIPKLNIALEYNGLFWHQNKGINYHKNKSELCKQQGIHLIHVWEDQWLDNKENIKNKIIDILTKNPIQKLDEYMDIDLSLENIDLYVDMGYDIFDITEPQIYSDNIWDCGHALICNNNKNKK